MSNKEQETIEDALIDLYLSVKIRSNEEVSEFKILIPTRLMHTTKKSCRKSVSAWKTQIPLQFSNTSRQALKYSWTWRWRSTRTRSAKTRRSQGQRLKSLVRMDSHRKLRVTSVLMSHQQITSKCCKSTRLKFETILKSSNSSNYTLSASKTN